MNTGIILVIRYSAGIVNWAQFKLNNSDQKAPKLMTTHHSSNPQSDIDQLYLVYKIPAMVCCR